MVGRFPAVERRKPSARDAGGDMALKTLVILPSAGTAERLFNG
jgi:hypothetical protein